MIESVNIVLESSDLKQDLFLSKDFDWYLRKGNLTNEKMFSFMLQYELSKVYHIDCDKPVMLESPNGKYLGLKTSRLDDKFDGSFRFEYGFKKKDFVNPNHILRIIFLNYIFNLGNAESALVFNRQKKILVKRGYSDQLIANDKRGYLKLSLYKMMCQSVKPELYEFELSKAIVLCDKVLKEKIKNLNNYFKPDENLSRQILSSFDSTSLERNRLDLLNGYYIESK